jgi:hypothetical protein
VAGRPCGLTRAPKLPYLAAMKLRATLFLAPLFLLACGGGKAAEPPPVAPVVAPQPEQDDLGDTEEADKPEAPTAEEPKAPKPAVRWAEGLSTPESVLIDGDRYLVSNIDGKPLDADGKGYISALSPDGKVIKDKWIVSGTNKVKLDAPKGMGISKGVLYVSDISVVRKFNAKSGMPLGDIPIKGATFLNDIAVGADGRVYVSDTGMKQGEKDFEPSGTDGVWQIDATGKVKQLAKGDLGHPNGLLSTAKGLLVVTFGSNELYRLDDKGGKADVTGLPAGGLDGIAAMGDSLLISSWKASAVFKGKLGDKFEVAVAGLKAPADITYDAKLGRVLVPRFMENAVEAYDLK